MLAPAWSDDHNYVGLSASALLAFIIVGAMSWTLLVAWDTLIIDYLIFGAVSAVILGGTLAGNADSQPSDNASDSSPTVRIHITFELLFFCCLAVGCLGVLLLSNQPMETSTSSTYGFTVISLYLMEQIRQSAEVVIPAVSSVVGFLCVCVAYDVGYALHSKQLARYSAVTSAICVFCLLAIGEGTLLLSVVMSLATIGFTVVTVRRTSWQRVVLMGLVVCSLFFVFTLSWIPLVIIFGIIVSAWILCRMTSHAFG